MSQLKEVDIDMEWDVPTVKMVIPTEPRPTGNTFLLWKNFVVGALLMVSFYLFR